MNSGNNVNELRSWFFPEPSNKLIWLIGGLQPCETLCREPSQASLDLWTTELWDNGWVLLLATKLVVIGLRRDRKLLQLPNCIINISSHYYICFWTCSVNDTLHVALGEQCWMKYGAGCQGFRLRKINHFIFFLMSKLYEYQPLLSYMHFFFSSLLWLMSFIINIHFLISLIFSQWLDGI